MKYIITFSLLATCGFSVFAAEHSAPSRAATSPQAAPSIASQNTAESKSDLEKECAEARRKAKRANRIAGTASGSGLSGSATGIAGTAIAGKTVGAVAGVANDMYRQKWGCTIQ